MGFYGYLRRRGRDRVVGEHLCGKIFFIYFKKGVDKFSNPCYNIGILKERRKQCFTNTSSEDAFATSPQRLSKFSKRNAKQSKMSAECGRISIEHTAERVRVMTQSIGQSTLTSSKIVTEYALATESDSESFGTCQQKPNKNF